MKYIKKPVIIEAMEFTQKTKQNVYNWAKSNCYNIEPSWDDDGNPCLLIPTLEGEMKCCIGDYLIKGIENEFYPCKPCIFKKTYEEVQ